MQDEIETEEIIKDIFQQGKTCFIPRYQFQSNHMDMVKLASPEEISSLPKTSWNIHQPSEVEVREEALSTGSLLSSTTSEPVEMRVCQWDLPFYFSTLTMIFLVILGPCKVDLKISQRLTQLKVVTAGGISVRLLRPDLGSHSAQAPDAQTQRPWLTDPAVPWHVGSSRTGARTRVPCIGRRTLNHYTTREALFLFFD
ncbi:5-formyltetrahydrofolate cyclo-ligase isoform X3 [Delphinus delphis]|uniref:5-formyltetrahydrofolate cyclo-ligase isoform X3 n=1 Tax=Delphinus delphis TaxID=9728 RepID=UPI0028C4DECA|nr:5-formyltetrahydrofolate cyclo-ligase isoform X3 [Delphinus delphis]